MDLLSPRTRTGMALGVSAGILAVCAGALSMGQKTIFTGALTGEHQSARFLQMAHKSGTGRSCDACHEGMRVPDNKCMACHTAPASPDEPLAGSSFRSTKVLHNKFLVAMNAHQGKHPSYEEDTPDGRRKDKPQGTLQSLAWGHYPRVPIPCASCHREHRQDRTSLEMVSNTVCESCHPHQHETPDSKTVLGSYLRRLVGPEAAEKDSRRTLDNWSHQCVTCHHEHGPPEPPEKGYKRGQGFSSEDGEIQDKTVGNKT